MAPRSAATSTTCSSSEPTTESSPSATSKAKASKPPSSRHSYGSKSNDRRPPPLPDLATRSSCTTTGQRARRHDTWYGEERIVSILERFGTSAAGVTNELLRDLLQFESDDPRADIAAVAVHVP